MLGLLEESPFVGQLLNVGKAWGRPDEKAAFWGEIYKNTVVPQGVSWAAGVTDPAKHVLTNIPGLTDPIQRKPRTKWQHFKMGIPGLRQTVPAKDPWAAQFQQ